MRTIVSKYFSRLTEGSSNTNRPTHEKCSFVRVWLTAIAPMCVRLRIMLCICRVRIRMTNVCAVCECMRPEKTSTIFTICSSYASIYSCRDPSESQQTMKRDNQIIHSTHAQHNIALSVQAFLPAHTLSVRPPHIYTHTAHTAHKRMRIRIITIKTKPHESNACIQYTHIDQP